MCIQGTGCGTSFAHSAPARAQDDAPILLQVNLLQLKPDSIEQFRDIHRDVFIPASKEAGTAWRVTRSTVLGPSFEYAVVIPIDNFAALDTPNNLGRTANKAALALELWRDSVVSRRSFIIQARPELSMEQEPQSDLYRRVRILVANNKNAEFEALWAEKILPALSASGATGYQLFQTMAGGLNTEYFGNMPIASYAALDGWGPFVGLSATDAAELTSQLQGVIESVEVSITSTDRELSFGLPWSSANVVRSL